MCGHTHTFCIEALCAPPHPDRFLMPPAATLFVCFRAGSPNCNHPRTTNPTVPCLRPAGKELSANSKERRAQLLAKKLKDLVAKESGSAEVAVMAMGKFLSAPSMRELALTEAWAVKVSAPDVIGASSVGTSRPGDQPVANAMVNNAREFFSGLKSEKGGGGGSTNNTVITAALAALVGDEDSMAGQQAAYVRLLEVRPARVKAAVKVRKGAMEADDKQYTHPSKAIYKNK